MKKSLLIAALFLFASTSYLMAQKIAVKDVPLGVRSELNRRYPDAGKANWEKEKGKYKANWTGKTTGANSALFSPAGAFVKLITPTPAKFLPIAVTSYVKAHYNIPVTVANKSIDETGKLYYEIKITGGRDAIFNMDGKFIRVQ